MTPEKAVQVADNVLLAHTGNPLKDIQRMILRESFAGKKYEDMKGWTPQHIKNEGKVLWKLLSAALGEDVSKTNFKGALEKRLKSSIIELKPPIPSNYNEQTWVGREEVVGELLSKLQGQVRLLWITGISGIGKTALGECLVCKAWESDPSFQWIYLEILEGQSPYFVSVAADLLAKLGESDLDPQERNDPNRLTVRLLRKLQANRYWIQLDSLERLLNPIQTSKTEFIDGSWVTFLQRYLMEPNFVSRIVLTAQVLPNALAGYANVWQSITLSGLSAHKQADDSHNEHLELFAKNGVTVNEPSSVHLKRIGQIYEGHPLVLQVIAKEILSSPFNGNVATYWQRYGNEFEQVARDLQTEQVNPALYNQELQRQVRNQIKTSLEQLPPDARYLLCRSSVYRRPVLETFWLAMIEDFDPLQQQAAYRVLGDRTLIEREGIHQEQFLIRQHNLIRDVAYEFLKAAPSNWEAAERQAAQLWLNKYKPAPNAPNLEKIRGYLEAFNHYCEIEDWEAAKDILLTPLNSFGKVHIPQQLGFWSLYQEGIRVCQKMLKKLALDTDSVCLRMLGYYYLHLGKFRESINYYEQALAIAQDINVNDRQGEGFCLSGLGGLYEKMGQYNKGIEVLQQQQYIAREIADRRLEARALGGLGNLYNRLGQFEQGIDSYQQCLVLFREIDDRQGECTALSNLGQGYFNLSHYELSIDFLEQSLTIAREIGDRQIEGLTVGNLGMLHQCLGQYAQAIDFYQQRLIIAREIGDYGGEGFSLCNMGISYQSLGQYEQAIDVFQQSLTIARAIGERQGESAVLGCLGCVYHAMEQYEKAIDFHQRDLTIAREIGNPSGESTALGNLANAYLRLGQYEQASKFHQQELTIVRGIKDRRGEAIALVNMGETQLKLGQYSDTLACNQAALEICQEIGLREEEATALRNLAEVSQALNDKEMARQYCQQALALATELGIPLLAECEELQQQLEEEDNQSEF